MMSMIRAVGVLGAGTMGAQLASFFASAGLDVLLLDVTAKDAAAGLGRATKLNPPALFTADALARIHTAGFDEGLPRLAQCDWIIESVAERVDAKQALLTSVDAIRASHTIVSTNTSGLSVAQLAEGRSEEFRRHWLGTHFFNPPRYQHLLELVPGPDTSDETISRMTTLADRVLGKGVVVAKDTPSFIANHLGMYTAIRVLDAWTTGPFTIEEIDTLTGVLLGRPRSATFRTLDLAGLDVLAAVSATMSRTWPHTARGFALPPVVDELINRGWLGEKTGQGFYKRVKLPNGASRILVLDPKRFEYFPVQGTPLQGLDDIRKLPSAAARIRTLFSRDTPAGAFTRETLAPALAYATLVTPAIASGPDDVDRVMRWGFGWEIGPFEIMDALGLDRLSQVWPSTPALAARRLAEGQTTFRTAPLPPADPGCLLIQTSKAHRGVVRSNTGASLVDLGDGVLCVEFHSKLNTIDTLVAEMVTAGIETAERDYRALVIGTEAPQFSAGANLTLVLDAARHQRWDEILTLVRAFQQMTWRIKYADIPVIVAPAGLTLGGGCEILLHANRLQAAAETYVGLVETGVGLIPAGGGTKEMMLRATPPGTKVSYAALLPAIQRAFETIALARVSTSARDAKHLGFLRDVDNITPNRDRLIADAKHAAVVRADQGYQPPAHADTIPVGGASLEAALMVGVHLAVRAGRATEYDAVIGKKLATLMAGGSLPHATTVTEEYLLELERETFVSLCGEARTVARIEHMLASGKPLRN